MATIRTLTSTAAAALLTLGLSMPTDAQAKPPLNIIAAAKQDGPSSDRASKNKASTKKAAKRTSARKSKKRVRAGGKKAVRTAKTKRPRQRQAHPAESSPAAVPAQPSAAKTKAAKTKAAETMAAETRPSEIRPSETKPSETKLFESVTVESASTGATGGHIMQGSDSVSLIARLPWWRGERLQAIQYQSTDDRNQMVAAAEAWLAEHGITDAEVIVPHNVRLASADTGFEAEDGPPGEAFAFTVTSAAELNELDRAASHSPLPNSNLLRTLIAVLGGALAAVASARLLFA